jgi:hypothetical protein
VGEDAKLLDLGLYHVARLEVVVERVVGARRDAGHAALDLMTVFRHGAFTLLSRPCDKSRESDGIVVTG